MAHAIREAIRDRAFSLGFDAVGFAEARLDAEARAGLREFIARGYHGDMGWLAGTAARRGDPQVLWSGARTVVVLVLTTGVRPTLLRHSSRLFMFIFLLEKFF